MSYAIKEIDIEILKLKQIEDAEQKIKKEIDLLSIMNHQNIIRYYGCISSKNKINIVLEYCNGSLSKLLKNFKTFKEDTIRSFLKQIINGLEYLHAQNIIHRDIKCANILINQGQCKLSDFGTSKIIKGDINSTLNVQGTLNWMAPECAKKRVTRFSDIWSLGCTVIEMVSGKPPYCDLSMNQLMRNLGGATVPPKIPEGVSESLKDFISKCLVVEAEKRYNVYKLKRHPFLSGKG